MSRSEHRGALPIAAAVGLLIVIVGAGVGIGFWVTSHRTTDDTSTNAAVVTNENANTATNTNDANANAATNVNGATKSNTLTNSTTVAETLPDGVQRYTSDDLDITFTYLDDSMQDVTVSEVENTVYVAVNVGATGDATIGQFVKVFSKDAEDTLAGAITKQFLGGYDEADCFVEPLAMSGFSDGISLAIISFPHTDDGINPWWTAGSACPQDYSETNGIRYFWMDDAHPGTFLYFDIGQYAIYGTDDGETDWPRTLELTGTSDWQTYRNDDLGFLFDYPSDWTVMMLDSGTSVVAYPTDLGGAATSFTVNERDISWDAYSAERQTDDDAFAVVSQSNTFLEGYAAMEYTTTNTAGVQLTEVFCLHNGTSTIITFRSHENDIQQAMLQSFQFTDTAMSDWQTYTNEESGYSVRYPSDWTMTERTDFVSLYDDTHRMTLQPMIGALDPLHIQGIYSTVTLPDILAIGDQLGYGYREGDGGCGGTTIQTALSSASRLQIDIGKCDGETNELLNDIELRDQILSTFQFIE